MCGIQIPAVLSLIVYLTFSEDDCSKRSKLKQLNKQLRSLKHKLEDLEFDFEVKHGYKPSQVRNIAG